jgi:hypothetical protein
MKKPFVRAPGKRHVIQSFCGLGLEGICANRIPHAVAATRRQVHEVSFFSRTLSESKTQEGRERGCWFCVVVKRLKDSEQAKSSSG